MRNPVFITVAIVNNFQPSVHWHCWNLPFTFYFSKWFACSCSNFLAANQFNCSDVFSHTNRLV